MARVSVRTQQRQVLSQEINRRCKLRLRSEYPRTLSRLGILRRMVALRRLCFAREAGVCITSVHGAESSEMCAFGPGLALRTAR